MLGCRSRGRDLLTAGRSLAGGTGGEFYSGAQKALEGPTRLVAMGLHAGLENQRFRAERVLKTQKSGSVWCERRLILSLFGGREAPGGRKPNGVVVGLADLGIDLP